MSGSGGGGGDDLEEIELNLLREKALESRHSQYTASYSLPGTAEIDRAFSLPSATRLPEPKLNTRRALRKSTPEIPQEVFKSFDIKPSSSTSSHKPTLSTNVPPTRSSGSSTHSSSPSSSSSSYSSRSRSVSSRSSRSHSRSPSTQSVSSYSSGSRRSLPRVRSRSPIRHWRSSLSPPRHSRPVAHHQLHHHSRRPPRPRSPGKLVGEPVHYMEHSHYHHSSRTRPHSPPRGHRGHPSHFPHSPPLPPVTRRRSPYHPQDRAPKYSERNEGWHNSAHSRPRTPPPSNQPRNQRWKCNPSPHRPRHSRSPPRGPRVDRRIIVHERSALDWNSRQGHDQRPSRDRQNTQSTQRRDRDEPQSLRNQRRDRDLHSDRRDLYNQRRERDIHDNRRDMNIHNERREKKENYPVHNDRREKQKMAPPSHTEKRERVRPSQGDQERHRDDRKRRRDDNKTIDPNKIAKSEEHVIALGSGNNVIEALPAEKSHVKTSSGISGLDALDEELDYDESMDDIERYLQEEEENQPETTLKSEVRVRPSLEEKPSTVSTEEGHEESIDKEEGVIQEDEEGQLAISDSEQEERTVILDPPQEAVYNQLSEDEGGEAPPSPHESGSDNDHEAVPVISSPIRLTPEPEDVVGKGQRSQQPGKGTQGARKESLKLPVKERLYLSKRDIDLKARKKEVSEYREQHRLSSNLESRLGPSPNEKGRTDIVFNTVNRKSKYGKGDAIAIAEAYRRRKRKGELLQHDHQEIKKGQRLAKLVNEHQTRGLSESERLPRKEEDVDKRISIIRSNNMKRLERDAEVRKDRQLHG